MSRFIDRISVENGIPNGLSVEDLYAYTKSMMFDYWEDKKNIGQVKKSEALAKKIIDIENNERAYENYFFVLVNSFQYKKIFSESKKLLEEVKFKKLALKNLSDKIFVEEGFMSKAEHIYILQERLSLSDDRRERKYIISMLKDYGIVSK